MIAVDTNVLIAAHRAEHPHHQRAFDRVTALAEGDAPWAVPFPVLVEFMRVTTHHRVFRPPSELAVALAFVEALLASPSLRLLVPGPDAWHFLRAALERGDARGNLVFDAQIAALCVEAGATRLVTFDRDFARFDNLSTEPT